MSTIADLSRYITTLEQQLGSAQGSGQDAQKELVLLRQALCCYYRRRFEMVGEPSDIERAWAFGETALRGSRSTPLSQDYLQSLEQYAIAAQVPVDRPYVLRIIMTTYPQWQRHFDFAIASLEAWHSGCLPAVQPSLSSAFAQCLQSRYYLATAELLPRSQPVEPDTADLVRAYELHRSVADLSKGSDDYAGLLANAIKVGRQLLELNDSEIGERSHLDLDGLITDAFFVVDTLDTRKDPFISACIPDPVALLRLRNGPGDDNEITRLYRKGACSAQCPANFRLANACNWVGHAGVTGDPSRMEAWQKVTSLVPELVWSGLSRSTRLIGIEAIRELASEGAASALSLGDVDAAVQMMERGRNLLWRQNRQPELLCQAIDALLQDNLIEESTRQRCLSAAHSLESILPSRRPPGPSDSSASPGMQMADAIVIDKILVDLPQLQARLLGSPTTEAISSVVDNGAVISLAISYLQSFAIVFERDHEPQVIALAGLTPQEVEPRVASLSKALSSLQNHGVRRRLQRTVLPELLGWLWNVIVSPLSAILQPRDGQKRRIWWCVSGALSRLPIHAASAPDGSNLLDSVISSYTTSLGRLVDTRGALAASGSPYVDLTIAISTATNLGSIAAEGDELASRYANSNIQICRLGGKTWTLLSIDAQALASESTSAAASDAPSPLSSALTRSNIQAAVLKRTWLHYAGHASQSLTSDPFDSALHLSPTEHLTLDDIAQPMPLSSDARSSFAFVNACEAGMGDAKVPDEALHVVGALQEAGFVRPIGSLWAVEDASASEVARRFYVAMGRELSAERASEALNLVLAEMRVEGRPYLDWLAFVHFGV